MPPRKPRPDTPEPILPPTLLHLPAARAARLVALHFLEKARLAYQRLENPEDRDALHDLRVALRELRSTIRAFRAQLRKRIPGKVRAELRELARATSLSRDLEVQIEWIDAQRMPRAGDERGRKWLARILEEKKHSIDATELEQVRENFPRVHSSLLAALQNDASPERDDSVAVPSFAAVLGQRLLDAIDALRRDLSNIHSIDDQERAHETRISGKRLRYMLAPIVAMQPAAKPIVNRLKSLQDILGDMHDAHVMRTQVAELRAAADMPRAPSQDGASQSVIPLAVPTAARFGLAELEQRLREREAKAYERLADKWLSPQSERFFGRARLFAGSLVDPYAVPAVDMEIERKYLLSRLPRRAQGAEYITVEQGWLPGTKLAERLRKAVQDGVPRYYRAIKFGSGVRRTEVEEETTEELFEAMWPLTEGKRVFKRRYVIPDGELRWEIDEFTDRELVLAEVELSSETEVVRIPRWLKAYVQREVTEEGEFVNMNLGR